MIIELFILIINSVKIYRREHNDGRGYWQFIKKALVPYDDVEFRWSRLPEKTKELLELKEYNQEGNIIEINHFLIQTVRIPTGPGNIRKLMQIALNIGQYNHDLDFHKLETYISSREIEFLERNLPFDLYDQVYNVVANLHRQLGIRLP